MSQIDAAYYPHIMDEVLRCALPASPQTLRRVCRYWRALVDLHEAHHCVLDMVRVEPVWPEAEDAASEAVEESDAPEAGALTDATEAREDSISSEGEDGGAGAAGADGDVEMPSVASPATAASPAPAVPAYKPRPARAASQNLTYVWEVLGARVPIAFLRCTPAGVEKPLLPWVDVRRHTQLLDVRAPGALLRDAALVRLVDGLALHTLRLAPGAGWGALAALPHTYRVVFADGPYARNLAPAAPPATAAPRCAAACAKTHLRRAVVNCRTPVTAPLDERVPHSIPRRLRELVVIFHGWGVIPAYNPTGADDADGGLGGDPRNDARALIVAAAQKGVRVTVVNTELRCLRRGVRT